MGRFIAIACAIGLHLGFILFGGALFIGARADHGTLQQVELISEDEAATEEEEKPAEPGSEEADELETEIEQPPEAPEPVPNLEPALEAASLGAIEAALSGLHGGGDFAEGLSFASGGRIGGTGKPGDLDDTLESAFSLAEIDQKPQVVFQAVPVYPASLRSRKLEGVVRVIFVVDPTGRVTSPRVEHSSHPAFDKPALDAVRKWKFEPAVKGGNRVACKMRVPIRFQPT